MIATLILIAGWALIAPSFIEWLFKDKPVKRETGAFYYDDNHVSRWKKDP